MPGLREWDYRPVYEASTANLVDDFYVPSLRRASRYDRAAGYFRSSIYILVAVAFSDFALRGGRMRLICSPALDDSDEEMIRRFGVDPQEVERSLVRDIDRALEHPDDLPVVQLLGTLLVAGTLDIRIAYKSDERGIFHSKVGIFRDADDAVSFEGSANETFAAWERNEERFKAFCTWRGDEQLIASDQEYFDRLWQGESPTLTVVPLGEVPLRLLRQHALEDPEAALERVRASRTRRSRTVQRVRRLQDHQLMAKHNWWMNQRGIIDHVTGGGKTVTALAIIRDWLERRHDGNVIVLVPSDLLSRQWKRELDAELADLDVRYLCVGGELGHPNWAEYLPDFTRRAQIRGRRLVLATVDSASSRRFVDRANTGDHTLLVADEVHTVGSPTRRAVLSLQAGGRLGLSATPERFGDEDGTQAIFDYFGDRLPPPFTIRDAQAAVPPRLVPYEYRPHILFLTPLEREEHERLTDLIAVASARIRDGDASIAPERLQRLLIQRAGVLKAAEAKPAFAARLLSTEYRPEDRWLVYCDDTAQLEAIRALLIDQGRDPMIYTSAMSFSKPDTLQRFERIGGILLAIKCLDEGVDIPLITHALILASSINPREHIQRRGRALRAAEGKTRAAIHDVLVGPTEDEPEQVFSQDLQRATSFAADALNGRRIAWQLGNLRPFPTRGSAASWGEVEDE